jgi:hypothetical protein
MTSSFKRQTLVFKDDNANIGTTTPSTSNSDTLKTRACKLHSVQGKPNKKLKKKKRWLSTCSFTIVNVINNFIHVVKEIEFLKMEMIKFVTSWMLQNEKNGKQMIIQGQL